MPTTRAAIRHASALLIAISCLSLSAAGCAGIGRSYYFHGLIPYPRTDAAEVLSAQATIHRRNVSIKFLPSGQTAPRFNYILDKYAAKTYDDRMVTLEKPDIANYPDGENANLAIELALKLPRGTSAHDVTHLFATLDFGQTTIELTPINRRTQEPIRSQTQTKKTDKISSLTHPTQQKPIPPLPPEEQSAALPGITSLKSEPVEPISAAPPGSVPVEVAFEQVVGDRLSAHVRWNNLEETALLLPGDKRTFYLFPGQHEFHAICHIPFISTTSAELPIQIRPEVPVRIIVEAEAKLKGANLRVHVWEKDTSIVDKTFTPDLEASLSTTW